MNQFDECQRPFSPCWCETRPNNSHCKDVITVPIDSVYFIALFIVLGVILAFNKFKLLKK